MKYLTFNKEKVDIHEISEGRLMYMLGIARQVRASAISAMDMAEDNRMSDDYIKINMARYQKANRAYWSIQNELKRRIKH